MAKQLGIKQIKNKLTKNVFIKPRKIHLIGKEVADGNLSRPIRAHTMQGPRVTIANSDYVAAGTEIKFQIHVLYHNEEITCDIIRNILEYGAYKGLGQFRSGGFGSFEIVDFDIQNLRPAFKVDKTVKKGKKTTEETTEA